MAVSSAPTSLSIRSVEVSVQKLTSQVQLRPKLCGLVRKGIRKVEKFGGVVGNLATSNSAISDENRLKPVKPMKTG